MPRLPRLARRGFLRSRSSCGPTPTRLSRSNPTSFPLGQSRQITLDIIPLPEGSAQLYPVSRSLEFEVSLGRGEVIGDIPGFGRVLTGGSSTYDAISSKPISRIQEIVYSQPGKYPTILRRPFPHFRTLPLGKATRVRIRNFAIRTEGSNEEFNAVRTIVGRMRMRHHVH